MNVVLPDDLEKYVESLVREGRYARSSEVIEEALREDRVNRRSFAVHMTPELERLLDEGVQDPELAHSTSELRRQR
jgi:putative addiction module CopG family antidote